MAYYKWYSGIYVTHATEKEYHLPCAFIKIVIIVNRVHIDTQRVHHNNMHIIKVKSKPWWTRKMHRNSIFVAVCTLFYDIVTTDMPPFMLFWYSDVYYLSTNRKWCLTTNLWKEIRWREDFFYISDYSAYQVWSFIQLKRWNKLKHKKKILIDTIYS